MNRTTRLAPLALLGLAAVSPAQTLYGVSYRTGGQTSGLNPYLYDVNPATGAATNRRAVNVNDTIGIAVSPVTGRIYGMTDQLGRINNTPGQGGKNLLFEINPSTGAATTIGRMDPNGGDNYNMFEGDLAFNPLTSTLWALSTRVNQAVLYTVDTATGLGTIRSVVSPIAGYSDLDASAMAFAANGDLWLLDTTYPNNVGPARLARVDAATGTILQSFVTNTVLGNAAGMTFAPDGRLLIVDGDTGGTDNLYRFDFTTGSLITIGATGATGGSANTLYDHGLAGLAFSAAPVPEPPALVALGLGSLALLRRRRRS